MGARRADASMVGTSVVDKREMRGAADDRGQPWTIVKKIKKKNKNLYSLHQSNFASTGTVLRCTVISAMDYMHYVNNICPY
jgi:hypothetical protein